MCARARAQTGAKRVRAHIFHCIIRVTKSAHVCSPARTSQPETKLYAKTHQHRCPVHKLTRFTHAPAHILHNIVPARQRRTTYATHAPAHTHTCGLMMNTASACAHTHFHTFGTYAGGGRREGVMRFKLLNAQGGGGGVM